MKKRMIFAMMALLAFLLFVSPMGPSPAKAEKIKLTFATTLAPKSNLELASQRFVRLIKERTGGRIEIIHYGASSLYHSKELIPAVAKNQVNLGLLHVAMVGRRSPVLEFLGSFGAQGCWESYEHYYRFIDHPEVIKIAEAEFEKYFNSKLLAPWAFGTGLVGAKRPIRKVDDFKGLKMRASGTAQATMYRALGAIPTELSSKEVYTALQRGTIEGATSGTSRFRRSKWYEVVPYITIDPTLPYLSFWLVINKEAWARLSSEDQELFKRTAVEVQKWTRDNAAKEREDDLAFLRKNPKVELIELPEAEKKKLIETVKPAMREFSKKRLGKMYDKLWGLLEATK